MHGKLSKCNLSNICASLKQRVEKLVPKFTSTCLVEQWCIRVRVIPILYSKFSWGLVSNKLNCRMKFAFSFIFKPFAIENFNIQSEA